MSADAACLSCPVCSYNGVFNSVQSLRDRLIYIATNKILCPVCQEEVCGLDKLTIHLFSHVKLLTVKGCTEIGETPSSKGETPYACTQCNKTFTFQQSYHKHLLYHNDEKPHTCTFCGRAFKELSTLHNHQRIHTGEKPFSCETCGKCFRQRVSYLVHRRIHTGVMPYKCTACQKSFRYKVSQRTHKCQAQPPGTVIRQNGELVEKLKKKHDDSSKNSTDEHSKQLDHLSYTDVSEANAELVRTGAKLSLEDMESEHFSLIADIVENGDINKVVTAGQSNTQTSEKSDDEIFDHNIEALMDSIPIEDKDIPSPSEILKNLCLSKEEDYISILHEEDNETSYNTCKDFNLFH